MDVLRGVGPLYFGILGLPLRCMRLQELLLKGRILRIVRGIGLYLGFRSCCRVCGLGGRGCVVVLLRLGCSLL